MTNFLIIKIISCILFGSIFGSFFSMLSWRLMHPTSFKHKYSFCPKCKAILKARDLIPLLSFIFNKGKCRQCHKPISWRYPIIEISTIILFFISFFHNNPLINNIILCAILSSLLIIVIVDIEHQIIFDCSQVMILCFSIIYQYLNHHQLTNIALFGMINFLIGLILYYGSIQILKKEGIGFGDVKFLGTCGIFLDCKKIIVFYLISGIVGTSFGLWWHYYFKKREFPFLPALAISLMICILLDEGTLDFYMEPLCLNMLTL